MSIAALTSRLPESVPSPADGRTIRHGDAARAESKPALAPEFR